MSAVTARLATLTTWAAMAWVLQCGGLWAQPLLEQHYPEIGRLGSSSYCNPYFGFRLALPAGLKAEPMHLPVQPRDQHMLLALHVARLDRTAELYIASYEDHSQEPARTAAKNRVEEARKDGLHASGPGTLKVAGRELLTVHVERPAASGPGDESSYYLWSRDHVIHAAILSHEPELIAELEKAMAHMEFTEPGEEACRVAPPAGPPPERVYYGPALPTGLVDATLPQALGQSVPAGELDESGNFRHPALGLRVALPPGWQPLEGELAARIPELMRDPVTDSESWDRRRTLFRSCTRMLFSAHDPHQELLPDVHPAMAVLALPMGCVPDLRPPEQPEDRAALEEFLTALLRSTGAQLLKRGEIRGDGAGRKVYTLDGALPWTPPGEKLARRMSLRLSATANGPWLLLIYSVTEAPQQQRELESRIIIGKTAQAGRLGEGAAEAAGSSPVK